MTSSTDSVPAAPKRPASKRGTSNGGSRKKHGLRGGTGEANRTAVAILEVLAGLRTPTEAAQSLEISVPRYYVLETRALEGLVAACEPKRLGKQPTPETRIAALEKQLQKAHHECARQQALVRAAQRTVGLSLPAGRSGKRKTGPAPTKPAAGKRRRRRPTVRALRAAKSLRENSSVPPEVKGLEKPVVDGSVRGKSPASEQEHGNGSQGKEAVGNPAR